VIGDLGDGSYTLTGGSVSVIGGMSSDIWVGSRGGAGTLEIDGADALVRVRRNLSLANNDRNSTTMKGSATVTIRQGTLAVNGMLKGRQTIANGYGAVTFTLSGGTLRPYNANATFGSSDSARNFDITIADTGSVISGLDDSVTPIARTVDMYANLVGSGNVTLSGGTFNLRGANTHSGTLTIGGATTVALLEGASLASAVTVPAGGTFNVSGLTGGFTLASGRPLGGAGTIRGSLLFDADSKLAFSSSLTVNSGTVTFTGFGIDDIVGLDGAVVSAGTYTLLSGNATFDLSGAANVGLANRVSIGGGKEAYLQQGSLQVVVVPVPEPAAIVLASGGLLAVAIGLRSRTLGQTSRC